MLRAVLFGALAAVLVVAALLAAVALHLVPGASPRNAVADGPVAVALVLPDPQGIATIRVLDVYTHSGGAWSVRSVSPTTTAVVSGTGGSTLADAYTFGGGDGLVAAMREQTGQAVTSWVIVDSQAWDKLRAGEPFVVDLTSDLEVFNGNRLFSFAAGHASVPATQVAPLFDGAAYLSAPSSRELRSQVGDVLAGSLSTASEAAASGVRTNVSATSLAGWRNVLKSVRRAPGT